MGNKYFIYFLLFKKKMKTIRITCWFDIVLSVTHSDSVTSNGYIKLYSTYVSLFYCQSRL